MLEAVTQLRAQAITLRSPTALAQVETALEQALGRLFALKEAYPELKASENFAQLQRDLVEVEDHLQFARRFYNGSVRDFHNGIARVPDVVIARGFGFREVEYFEAQPDGRAAVTVDMTP